MAVELREMYTAEQIEALLRGEIDVGLLKLPIATEGLPIEIVFDEPLVAALPDNHRLVSKLRVALKDLADGPFVFFPRWMRPRYHDMITGLWREAGYIPRVVQETASKQSIVGLVAAA